MTHNLDFIHATALAAALLCAAAAGPLLAQAPQPTAAPAVSRGEPNPDEAAALQKKYGDKVSLDAYRAYHAVVDKLTPEEQKWERVLEDQLGSYYFPLHLQSRLKPGFEPQNQAWGFVRDDPALPRVLLIGDSISHMYTVAVRQGLAGKANVHRAPTNCGPTDTGLKNLDIWLDQGSGTWDLIYANFGIHDRRKTPEQYAANLEKILARLQATGATLVWARTTPFGEKVLEGGDESVPLNRVADQVMQKHGIPIDDLHAVVAATVATVQSNDHTHFNAEGVRLLAAQVVKAIEPRLRRP
jgi:lysophospholipase L1-like esterase